MAPKSVVELDTLDRALVAIVRAVPHVSISELARRAAVPRATAQGRLARLERLGVIVGYGPDIDPAAVGFGVTAFTVLEIAQGAHDETVAGLGAVPEVLEIHTVTGVGDLLCRVVARSNDDLHRVLQRVTALPTVTRSQTQIALSTPLHRTVADVVGAEAPTRVPRRAARGRATSR